MLVLLDLCGLETAELGADRLHRLQHPLRVQRLDHVRVGAGGKRNGGLLYSIRFSLQKLEQCLEVLVAQGVGAVQRAYLEVFYVLIFLIISVNRGWVHI